MPAPAGRWRLLVHALDRTGPPMLVQAIARWLARTHPEITVEVLAFRGGPLADELADVAAVTVVLDHHEPWDHASPNPARVHELRARLGSLAPCDVNLFVSVSAGQVMPLLGRGLGPFVVWSVEVGEDLHWIHDLPEIVDRTDRWLAGSATTRAELDALVDAAAPTPVVGEFVDPPSAASPDEVARCRSALGAGPGDRLVVGAGIGTARKGLDLFAELAAWDARQPDASGSHLRFAWLGGESDVLHAPVARLVAEAGLDRVRLVPSVPDVTPWFAAADAFVHAARVDAFPLVCLHASAAGTPVVSFSGTGGTQEMFGPTFAGAPYPDVAALGSVVRVVAGTSEGAALAARQGEWIEHRSLTPHAAPRLFDAIIAGHEHVPASGERS